ncbi:GNAT family N-acetyltransferase [Dactylosporangium matsuzakiense]|uniref:N-acetyltransferase GCN5 n=1 Tax=Dactylosporangium matsuzakiense TaxID=53360 RepID=A0A9W6KM53_9ACTN|nr:GNAT family N-acetyltransferase [Dactylosporangium matsuzakiense]UWZ48089.1 GNAT family N-acetyltransferase [Dactylosporangium matsuzakiense]GLL03577.1 N-acetyltransferase GCN5 [Dactylosporangium matsuzakiense]
MTDFDVRALDAATWDGFAALVAAHNGVFGGCWCMAFHAEGVGRGRTPADNRAAKEARVRDGRAHAALVYEGEACVGWCQYGPAGELPRIKRRKAYEEGGATAPDWRITCFFVARSHRRRGVADAALGGALELIATAGGGVVESYPEEVAGRTVANAFLHNGTVALFERHGFARDRRIGKHHWVVRRVVGTAPDQGVVHHR